MFKRFTNAVDPKLPASFSFTNQQITNKTHKTFPTNARLLECVIMKNAVSTYSSWYIHATCALGAEQSHIHTLIAHARLTQLTVFLTMTKQTEFKLKFYALTSL